MNKVYKEIHNLEQASNDEKLNSKIEKVQFWNGSRKMIVEVPMNAIKQFEVFYPNSGNEIIGFIYFDDELSKKYISLNSEHNSSETDYADGMLVFTNDSADMYIFDWFSSLKKIKHTTGSTMLFKGKRIILNSKKVVNGTVN